MEYLHHIKHGSLQVTPSATLSADGTMSGKVSCSYNGNEAYPVKEFHNEAEKEEDIIENVEKQFGAEISDYQSIGCSDYSGKCQETMLFTKKCDCTPELIIVDPFLVKFQDEDSFRAETRDLPVDFDHCLSVVYRLTLSIPDGYAVDQMPENIRYESSQKSSATIQFMQGDGSVQLMYRFNLDTLLVDKIP